MSVCTNNLLVRTCVYISTHECTHSVKKLCNDACASHVSMYTDINYIITYMCAYMHS